MQGMDWRLDSAAGCYVSGERLRVVDDCLEVYIARVFVGEAQERIEVLRRYGLVQVDPNRVVGEKLWLQMGGMVNAPAIRVEIGIDGVLRLATDLVTA
jgi:hypothetical protein